MYSIQNTKTEDFSRQIDQLFVDILKSNQLIDEFGWRRCMDKVKELKDIQEFTAQAYANEGVLFALKADKENSFAAFKKAMELDSSNKATSLNYINAAIMLGEAELAAKTIMALSKQSDGNSKYIYALLTCSARCCMFNNAEIMLLKLKKLNKTEIVDKLYASDINEAYMLLNKHNFFEQELVERLDVAAKVVFNMGKTPLFARHIITTKIGIMYKFILNLPFDKLVEIDWAIADALTKKFDNPMIDLISFSTTPFIPQKSYKNTNH